MLPVSFLRQTVANSMWVSTLSFKTFLSLFHAQNSSGETLGQNWTDKAWPEDLTLLYCGGGTNLSNSKILNFDRKTEERLLRSKWYCILYTDVHLDILWIRNSWFQNKNVSQRIFLTEILCLSLECVNVNIIFQIIGWTPAGTLNNMNLNIKQLSLNMVAEQQNIIFNLINSFCHCTVGPGRWKTWFE